MCCTLACKGGILADEMGMGKTLQVMETPPRTAQVTLFPLVRAQKVYVDILCLSPVFGGFSYVVANLVCGMPEMNL